MEDGEAPVCSTLCEEAAQTLPLTYHAMHANAGRCETGNAGVCMAQTKYVCFLDDDDYFFAEHLETMAAALEQNPECSLFFAGSVEAACARGAALQVEHFWSNCRAQLTREGFFAGNPVSI